MNDLLTAITTALRTVTPKTYYLHLPDDSFLTETTVTYRVSNSFNEDVIEKPEAVKTFDCIVTINSAKITKTTNGNNEMTKILALYDPIKGAMYALPVAHIKVLNEDSDFDPFRETYYISIRFEIIT